MTPKQIAIVQSHLHAIKAIGKPFAKVFYARLFQLAPDLRTLFNCAENNKDRKLINMLCTTVHSLENMDGLKVVAHNMGQRYSEQGVNERHYDFFIQAMLETLEMALGDEFSGDSKAAWVSLLAMLKSTLLEASNYHEIEHTAWGREVPMALVG
jgi:nitric oxide dioxygenase